MSEGCSGLCKKIYFVLYFLGLNVFDLIVGDGLDRL